MIDLTSKFEKKKVDIESLLFDPNNPRFASKYFSPVSDYRICEKRIQEGCLRELNTSDLELLKNSIAKNGFLPIGRIIVRGVRCNGNQNYLIIDGNRRVAAIRELLNENEVGERTLEDFVLRSLKIIETLVFIGKEFDIMGWTVRGISDIQGGKSWGLLSTAKFVGEMYERDSELYSIEAMSRMMGASIEYVSRLLFAHQAFMQAIENPKYELEIEERTFRIFFAIFDAPAVVREWLEWNPSLMQFENDEAFDMLCTLVLGQDNQSPKITKSVEVRRLLPDLLNRDLDPSLSIVRLLVHDNQYTLSEAISEMELRRRGSLERDELLLMIESLRNRMVHEKTVTSQDLIDLLKVIEETLAFKKPQSHVL